MCSAAGARGLGCVLNIFLRCDVVDGALHVVVVVVVVVVVEVLSVHVAGGVASWDLFVIYVSINVSSIVRPYSCFSCLC